MCDRVATNGIVNIETSFVTTKSVSLSSSVQFATTFCTPLNTSVFSSCCLACCSASQQQKTSYAHLLRRCSAVHFSLLTPPLEHVIAQQWTKQLESFVVCAQNCTLVYSMAVASNYRLWISAYLLAVWLGFRTTKLFYALTDSANKPWVYRMFGLIQLIHHNLKSLARKYS